MLIPRIAAAQAGSPDFGTAGLSSVLPLPLWVSPSHGTFFEHPTAILTASQPLFNATWTLDRTLDERSSTAVDRFRIHGMRNTLEFVSPLITGSDSVYVGHIAVRYERGHHDLAWPFSSDGQGARHTLDYSYGQLTYGRTVGARLKFAGAVGTGDRGGDHRVDYSLQGTYDRTGLLRA